MNPGEEKFAVFVDRDGTICFDKHYLADPGGLELIQSVAEGIKKLNDAGIPVIVITNQSGIGRGYFTEKQLEAIHGKMKDLLAEQGARVDDIFYCPHLPDSGCGCRKPRTGMLLQAQDKLGLDLKRSFVIGDRTMDVEMAHAVGAKAVLVPEPGNQYHVEKEMENSLDSPDYIADTFVHAVEWILSFVQARP